MKEVVAKKGERAGAPAASGALLYAKKRPTWRPAVRLNRLNAGMLMPAGWLPGRYNRENRFLHAHLRPISLKTRMRRQTLSTNETRNSNGNFFGSIAFSLRARSRCTSRNSQPAYLSTLDIRQICSRLPRLKIKFGYAENWQRKIVGTACTPIQIER
jgi:hypothetical protein